MTTVQAGPGDVLVQLDVFPADALLAEVGTTFKNCRVAVADGNVQIWRYESAGPALIFDSPMLSYEGSARTAWTFTTERGTVIAGHSGGCMCGQRLGTAQLWPGRRRINTSL